jgi:redox-sensitive bicupin YhaK (pirin superfamily)
MPGKRSDPCGFSGWKQVQFFHCAETKHWSSEGWLGDVLAMTTKTTTPHGAVTVTRRPAQQRGETELGWLHSRHSFSFGEYIDPDHMGFHSLRVINDDIVEPGMGFGTHPHRDAEIFSYVIEGQLQHKDSMGSGSIINTGDLQYISAGKGLLHSEFNPSRTARVHFLQIWLLPNARGGEPRYAEKTLGSAALPNALTLLFSGDGRDGSVAIRQDADIFFGKLDANRSVEFPLNEKNAAYLHVIKGRVKMRGEAFEDGDGAEIEETGTLELTAEVAAEFLLSRLI